MSGFDTGRWTPRPLVRTRQFPASLAPSMRGSSACSGISRRPSQWRAPDSTQGPCRGLWPLDSVRLPDSGVTATGSDVVGVLWRYAELLDLRPRLVLLLTDLADSRYRELPPIAKPAGAVRLVVLLAPATSNDAKLTMGKALSASDQYRNRSDQIGGRHPGSRSCHTSPATWRRRWRWIARLK